MMVLITYDVNTESKSGKSRLRKVAKLCVDYGQRVQNSVFECSITPAEFVEIKYKLAKIVDLKNDSIRFYLLGKNWQKRLEKIGKNDSYDPDKDLLIL
ncbi:CRISPR-associated endonuclease Cas2 [Ligilactobacillus sp. Marseille-Q7487]|jgi:CRISPR-associated protein Cas2|uniref:CRISPR-associated endonuclease Cas2 n=1 Tax=Ligilactobacillus sp. Marseille-Q7487 TaxID=3022128 RepID=UPI0024A84DA1|nr:CRISPR-associated endonuclease Cas2 [Ligilactobacillus sp. Marseille-Q7487]